MKKIVLIVVAVVAILAVAYFSIAGWPPERSGTQATVGVAKRHRQEQIKTADVKLTDAEVQAFLQSDTFDKIMRDQKLRKLLASPEVQKALKEPKTVQALSDPDVQKALGNPQMVQAFNQLSLVTSTGGAAAVSPAFGPDVTSALTLPNIQYLSSNSHLVNLVANPTMALIISNLSAVNLGAATSTNLSVAPSIIYALTLPQVISYVTSSATSATNANTGAIAGTGVITSAMHD